MSIESYRELVQHFMSHYLNEIREGFENDLVNVTRDKSGTGITYKPGFCKSNFSELRILLARFYLNIGSEYERFQREFHHIDTLLKEAAKLAPVRLQ